MLHLLPCLTTFNLVMHHIWLCIMPCLCLCVYHVVCFFPVVLLLDSSGFVAIVRIRSTMWFVFFMDSFFFRVGFQARWSWPWISLLSLLASCLLAIAMSRFLPHICQPPICHDTASNHPYPANRYLSMLPLCSAISHSVASCRCSYRLFNVGTWISWDITIAII